MTATDDILDLVDRSAAVVVGVHIGPLQGAPAGGA